MRQASLQERGHDIACHTDHESAQCLVTIEPTKHRQVPCSTGRLVEGEFLNGMQHRRTSINGLDPECEAAANREEVISAHGKEDAMTLLQKTGDFTKLRSARH